MILGSVMSVFPVFPSLKVRIMLMALSEYPCLITTQSKLYVQRDCTHRFVYRFVNALLHFFFLSPVLDMQLGFFVLVCRSPECARRQFATPCPQPPPCAATPPLPFACRLKKRSHPCVYFCVYTCAVVSFFMLACRSWISCTLDFARG